MKILNYCVNTAKEFPLKDHFKIDKKFEHILGVVTEQIISEDVAKTIDEKSSGNVSLLGNIQLDELVINFFGLKGVISSAPLLNSINKYLGNTDKIDVYFVPSLKDMCIDPWGELIYNNFIINSKKVSVKYLER